MTPSFARAWRAGLRWVSVCAGLASGPVVADSTVVFNEIQYHPAGSGPELEWVELHNQMSVNMDLSRWRLAGGVEFDFPEGTVVPGGGYVVVAGDPAAARTTFGVTNVIGPFTGRLSNSGETLELRNNNQRLMDSVKYGTDGEWPVAADGFGVTLAKRAAQLASGPARNWTLSAQVGGTPGAANFPALTDRPLVPLLATGQRWRVENSGGDLGTFWRESDFDDRAWGTVLTPAYAGAVPPPGGERQAIPSLFSTGVGPDGKVLAPGSFDPHYTVTLSAEKLSPPPPTAARAISGHPAWAPNDDTSSWLGPVEPGTANVAAGNYRYQTTFDLTGFDPATADLSVSVAADNRLNDVLLNGVSTGISFVGFSQFSPEFKLTSGFQAGTNTLEFLWANDTSSPNPAGFRARLAGTAKSVASPESNLGSVRPTTYARSVFVFSGNPAATQLVFSAAVDDGAVIYLNGAEVLRLNLPTGPVTYSTPASTSVPAPPPPVSRVIPPGFLRAGTNILAVELHQATDGLGDAWFDLAVAAQSAVLGEASPVVFNELGPGDGGFFLEIANTSPNTVSLDGYRVVRRGTAESEFKLPAGTTIGGGGMLAFDERQLGFRPGPGDALALVPPAGTSVADAVTVPKVLRGRYPDSTGTWRFPDRGTPGATNAFAFHRDVVINEIFYHPHDAAPSTTWVELFNRGQTNVDLTGWRFSAGIQYPFPSGTTLAAGGYLVVAQDPPALKALHPAITVLGPFTNSLSRGGERLVLEDAAGNPASEVRYFDGGRWPERADGGGSSLELRHPWADAAAGEAWAASRETASTWSNYTYRATAVRSVGPTQWNEFVLGLLDDGECLLDDVRVTESPDTTPVSLLTNGNFENGATGWRLLGTHRSSRVVVDPENAANHVLHLVATGPTEHMHNHVETTLAGNRAIVNGRVYEVSFRAKWLGGNHQLNTRLYFNRVARTTVLGVPGAAGTPGARNSTFETNLGPTFSELRHLPVVPDVGKAVAVSVAAADPDGVASARVLWSANGGAWQNQALVLQPDGRYGAALPGATAGTVVQFYVEATDGLGATASFPAGGTNSRALYVVNDQRASLAKLHNLRILMTPRDTAWLHTATNVMSNDYLGATVIADESEIFYDAGVHLQGSERGRPDTSRVGFTLRFPPDHLFRGVHRTISIDRSGGYTGVGADQDEILLKHVVQHAGGLPGMYDDLVRIIPARTDLTGPGLLLLAKYGDVFLESQYADGGEGNEFKLELVYSPTSTHNGNPQGIKLPQPDDVIGMDLSNQGDDPEVYRWYFLQENNRSRNDYRQVIALAQAMSRAGTALDAETQRLMDVDLWMRAVAFQILFGLVDTYPFDNRHNFMIYFRPDDGRAVPFLWDMDFNFGASPTAPINRATGTMANLMNLPANQRRFQGHLLDIITTTYNRTYLAPWVSHYGGLVGQNFGGILGYVDQRVASVRSQLGVPVAFSVAPAGGAGFIVDTPTLVLSGRAWIDIRDLRLRDQSAPLDLRWSNPTTWTTSVPLVLGNNRLELVAYDYQGVAVLTNVIEVTSTATSGGLDTDGDGMPDAWESAHGLNPRFPDAGLDLDADDFGNLQEYLAGTDPQDPNSHLRLTATRGADGMHVSFLGQPGRSYSVVSREALGGGDWQRVTDFAPASTVRTLEVVPPGPAPGGVRYYRVVTPRMP